MKFARFYQKKHALSGNTGRSFKYMLYFSVRNDDKFVIIVVVKRGIILVTPVEIDSLLRKGHIDVEYFMLDKCVRFLRSHRKNLEFFGVIIIQVEKIVKSILAKITFFLSNKARQIKWLVI